MYSITGSLVTSVHFLLHIILFFMQNKSFYLQASVPGDNLICSRFIDQAAFEVAIFAAFKLKLYYFSKAVIL